MISPLDTGGHGVMPSVGGRGDSARHTGRSGRGAELGEPAALDVADAARAHAELLGDLAPALRLAVEPVTRTQDRALARREHRQERQLLLRLDLIEDAVIGVLGS